MGGLFDTVADHLEYGLFEVTPGGTVPLLNGYTEVSYHCAAQGGGGSFEIGNL